MDISGYTIEKAGIDWSEILSKWGWLLPPDLTLWIVNRFGDLILVLPDGRVQFVDIGGGTIQTIAPSREHFFDLVDSGSNANDWFAIPLVDHCVGAGLVPAPGQCYMYAIPPILGGEYSVDNFRVGGIKSHFDFLAEIHRQIKDLPDGAKVSLRVEV
jgi:hypothetical protein